MYTSRYTCRLHNIMFICGNNDIYCRSVCIFSMPTTSNVHSRHLALQPCNFLACNQSQAPLELSLVIQFFIHFTFKRCFISHYPVYTCPVYYLEMKEKKRKKKRTNNKNKIEKIKEQCQHSNNPPSHSK